MLSRKELKHWQDEMFEKGKEIMIRDGFHLPLALLITEYNRVSRTEDQGLKIAELDLSDPEKMIERAQEAKPIQFVNETGKPIFITVPLTFNDEEALQIMVEVIEAQQNWKTKEELQEFRQDLRETLSSLYQMGKQMKVENTTRQLLNALLKITHLHEKDLQAFALQKAISMAGAYAYCKLDEMWFKTSNPLKGKDLAGAEIEKAMNDELKKTRSGISKDPERIEGLGISMECENYTRLLFAEVHKEGGRDSNSKVLGFGETQELIDREASSDKGTLEGRFSDLLKKSRKLDPPKIQA